MSTVSISPLAISISVSPYEALYISLSLPLLEEAFPIAGNHSLCMPEQIPVPEIGLSSLFCLTVIRLHH